MEIKKLGFGLMRLPVIDGNPEHIDLEQVCKMVDLFLERGFTYFDTAWAYHSGKSEEAVKEALVKRHPRESFLLASKLPTFAITAQEQVQQMFEQSLEFSFRRFGLSRIVYNAHIVPYRAALIGYRPVKFRAVHKLLHQICTTILPVNQRKSRGKFHSRNLLRDFLVQIYTTVLPINRR